MFELKVECAENRGAAEKVWFFSKKNGKARMLEKYTVWKTGFISPDGHYKQSQPCSVLCMCRLSSIGSWFPLIQEGEEGLQVGL